MESDAMNRIREFLKSAGGFVLGVVLLAAIMFAFDFGVVHFYTTVTVLYQIELWMAALLVVIFLPVSIFRHNRAWCAYVFKGAWMTSGFLGFVFCILVSMAAIGLGWTIAAVVFGGVPVIFIAIGVLIYHHTWPLLAAIGIYIVVTAVAGWYGEYLEDHAGEQGEQLAGEIRIVTHPAPSNPAEEIEEPVEKHNRSLQYLKPWVRWILVLPAAIVAWIGIQFGLIMISGVIDLAWAGKLGGLNDTYLVQMLNSIAGAWAFVVAGRKTAPAKHGATALCLTALFIMANLGAVYFVQESGGGPWQVEWSLICFVVSALTMGVVTYEICRNERQERMHEMERGARILRVNPSNGGREGQP